MIVPRLPEFLAQHPSLDIDILLDDRVIDVVAEGIDIALRMGALSDSSAVARKLATGARSVVATPDYLARTGMPKIPADLVNHHALVYSQLNDTWAFRRGEEVASVTVRGRVRLSAAEGSEPPFLLTWAWRSHLIGCSRQSWQVVRCSDCCQTGRFQRLIFGPSTLRPLGERQGARVCRLRRRHPDSNETPAQFSGPNPRWSPVASLKGIEPPPLVMICLTY